MNTAQRRSRAYVQLINSKVPGCCLVVCEQCGSLRPRLTHQASLSSIFSSTSPLLCPSAMHRIITIYSFWFDFSVGEFSIPHHTGWLLEERRRGPGNGNEHSNKSRIETWGVISVSSWHRTSVETNVTYRTNQISAIKIKTYRATEYSRESRENLPSKEDRRWIKERWMQRVSAHGEGWV